MFRVLAIAVLAMSALGAPAAEGVSLAPGRAHVLVGDAGKGLLEQCSRDTPRHVVDFWIPGIAAIQRLERGLPRAIAERARRGQAVPPDDIYDRQYVGIVVEGRRLIYGNFMSASYLPMLAEVVPNANDRITFTPVVACDGGPSFWGVVFDPAQGSFEDFEFNGPV